MDKELNYDIPEASVNKIIEVLTGPLSHQLLSSTENAFYAACKIVADCVGIQLSAYATSVNNKFNYLEVLENLSRRSSFRYRKVVLEAQWWRQDNGPLLCIIDNDVKPCALIFHKDSYYLIDPAREEKVLVDEIQASRITAAFYFYRPLPSHRLKAQDIFRYVYQLVKPDIWRVIFMQILISLIGLAIPLATGYLFSTAIPYADLTGVGQVVIILIVNAFVITGLQLTQIISLFRIKLKANALIQAGLWDRILQFPINFFKKFEVGDLANRTTGIDLIQQELTLSLIISITSSAVVLFTLVFLFCLAPILTLLILIPIFIIGVTSLLLSIKEMIYLRQHFMLFGQLYALLLQLFSSISKIKVAHREKKMYQLWAEKFAAKTHVYLKSGNVIVINKVFNLVFSLFVTMLFYSYMILSSKPMAFSIFIMYSAAFSQMFLALLNLWGSVNQLVRIIPLYERAKPILSTLPENYGKEGQKHRLVGHIEFKDIKFNYPGNEVLICDNLSLDIPAGHYVGIIGQSGVGKSTLIRLLLGFEQPQMGSIYYDGYNLSSLDHAHLRSQLSVILQNSALMPGTIEDNINGINTGLTTEDAWKAAKLANIEDEILNMPMGMRTVILERGGTLSLGQRQRILIARALAKNPQIIMLDEAMSGMDEITLSKLKQCVEKLKITRIVITQRPEFLEKADMIYILGKGQVIAKGSYAELLNLEAFAKLNVL